MVIAIVWGPLMSILIRPAICLRSNEEVALQLSMMCSFVHFWDPSKLYIMRVKVYKEMAPP